MPVGIRGKLTKDSELEKRWEDVVWVLVCWHSSNVSDSTLRGDLAGFNDYTVLGSGNKSLVLLEANSRNICGVHKYLC